MTPMVSILITTLLGVAAVQASPAHVPRQSTTLLTTSQIDAFTPYSYFAKAAYCDPSTTRSWSCVPCGNNPGFKPVASGGDGNAVQYWYVGYDSDLDTVIVAHQGSNTSDLLSLLTDGNIILDDLNASVFPGLPSDIQVHSGFQDEHSKTAERILSSVETALFVHGAHSVTLVGHSLGAALSLLDSVYLPLNIPSASYQTILYGLPRVGNGAFADYVDANLHVTHINNLKDPIPIVPGRFLGYAHPSGEVHIRETGDWVTCSGQDNPSTECIVGDVPTIFDGDPANHDGPYNGVRMKCMN